MTVSKYNYQPRSPEKNVEAIDKSLYLLLQQIIRTGSIRLPRNMLKEDINIVE